VTVVTRQGPRVIDPAGIRKGAGACALNQTPNGTYRCHDDGRRRTFGAHRTEESGLLGSNYYVNDLVANNPTELENIAAYLNFDMVASPNFVRFVYDGNQSTYPAPMGVTVPPGSPEIEQTFHDYFASQALYSDDTEFSGRSDYQAFIAGCLTAS